jgi:DNA polymerase-3 subunit epsilon
MAAFFEKLERDIIFFDLETTGILLKEDRIIEITAVKFSKDGSRETFSSRINPGRPINPQATEVHNIRDEDLINCPSFSDLSEKIWGFFNGCDLGGYNCLLFDIPILYEEFVRCGKNINFFGINIIDCYNLLNKYESRKLTAVYKRFFGEELENSHSSAADIDATIRVFERQISEYGLEEKSIKEISDVIRSTQYGEKILDFSGWFRLKDGVIYFGKGKWKGTPVKDNMDYLDWIISNDNLESNSRIVAKVIKGKLVKESSQGV